MVSLHPGSFIPGVRAPVTHWVGGWVGPRAGLDTVHGRNRTAVVHPKA